MQLDGVGKLASKRSRKGATSGQGGLVASKMRRKCQKCHGGGAGGGLQPADGPQVLDGRDAAIAPATRDCLGRAWHTHTDLMPQSLSVCPSLRLSDEVSARPGRDHRRGKGPIIPTDL